MCSPLHSCPEHTRRHVRRLVAAWEAKAAFEPRPHSVQGSCSHQGGRSGWAAETPNRAERERGRHGLGHGAGLLATAAWLPDKQRCVALATIGVLPPRRAHDGEAGTRCRNSLAGGSWGPSRTGQVCPGSHPQGFAAGSWGCGARHHPSSFLTGLFTPRSGFAPYICAFIVVKYT